MAIGELIRARRLAHGLSQRRLALRAGTSQAAIAAIETGRRSPTMVTVEQLLMALGEELDLAGAVRPSKWRDHDPEGLKEFQALSMEERLAVGLSMAGDMSELRDRSAVTLPRLELATLLAALLEHEVEFIVIGGVAVIAHGVRRTTLDADIVTVTTPKNDERVAAAYAQLGVRSTRESPWRDLDPTDPFDVARAGHMRVVTDAGRLGIVHHEDFDRLAATAIETTIAGHRVRIASRDELIAMKLAAGRPRDLQDVADLTAGEAADA